MIDAVNILVSTGGVAQGDSDLLRTRMATAYLLLTDPDSRYAIARQLVKLIVKDYRKADELLQQLTGMLTTKLVSDLPDVDFSQDIADLRRLSTGSTQIGQAVVSRVLKKVDGVGRKVGGVTLEELRGRVEGTRLQLDFLISRISEGVAALIRGHQLDLSTVERFHTSVRASAAAAVLQRASDMTAIEGTDQLLDNLAMVHANVFPVEVASSEVRKTVRVTPVVSAGSVHVQGTPVDFPLHNSEAKTITVGGETLPIPAARRTVLETKVILFGGEDFPPGSVLSLQQGEDGLVHTIAAEGMITATELADAIEAGFPDVVSKVSLSPTDSGYQIHIYGNFGYDLISSSSEVFGVHTLVQSHAVAVTDIAGAWAEATPSPPIISVDGVGQVTLNFPGLPEVTLAGDVDVLGLPAGRVVGHTNRVMLREGILRPEDVVLPGGKAVRQVEPGVWMLADSIPCDTATLNVSISSYVVHKAVVTMLNTTKVVEFAAEHTEGLSEQFWRLLVGELPAADRSRALSAVGAVREALQPLDTLLSAYRVPESPEVGSIFTKLSAYGMDLAVWYLATGQLRKFLGSSVSDLSRSGLSARLERELAMRLLEQGG